MSILDKTVEISCRHCLHKEEQGQDMDAKVDEEYRRLEIYYFSRFLVCHILLFLTANYLVDTSQNGIIPFKKLFLTESDLH